MSSVAAVPQPPTPSAESYGYKRWRTAAATVFGLSVFGLAAWAGHVAVWHRNFPPLPAAGRSNPPSKPPQPTPQAPQEAPAADPAASVEQEGPGVPVEPSPALGRRLASPKKPRVRVARSTPPSPAKPLPVAGTARFGVTDHPADTDTKLKVRSSPPRVADESLSNIPEQPVEPPAAKIADAAPQEVPDEAVKTPPTGKRRNVIIRMLGRIFGKHTDSAPPADPPVMPDAK